MRIAIFDYVVIPNNAIGNCDRRIMAGLCDEHEFTVFAIQFDNPRPDKIRFVRVPVPRKPLFLMFILFHLVAPVIFLFHKLKNRVSFDIVQGIESKSLFVSLVYAHFCHRAYLRDHFAATRPPGVRGFARMINHTLHSWLEPLVYRSARQIVVPSQGLSRELITTYGEALREKITVISNPVDVERMKRPADFDVQSIRSQFGFAPDDFVMIFIALGHFERKGLPLLLDAMQQVADPRVKLLVIGGTPGLIKTYQDKAAAMGLANQSGFAGMQKDVRPYLWASDVFAFPSSYEIFPLVSLEAAAAGVPLLTSPLYGVEELLVDGVNGWRVERNAAALAEKMRHAIDHRDVLQEMGQKAAESAKKYDNAHFVENWRTFYAGWGASRRVADVKADIRA